MEEVAIIPAIQFKAILNRLLTFVDRTKIGINPLFAAVRIKDDKAYVFNGETGAVQSLPFALKNEITFPPFALKVVANSALETDQIKIIFDAEKRTIQLISPSIKIKIKTFGEPPPPKEIPDTFLVRDSFEHFYEHIKRAAEFAHFDASLPLCCGLKLGGSYVAATDQRGIFLELGMFEKLNLVIPALITDHIVKLGIEPMEVAIDESHIYCFYTDLIIYGMRLEGDAGYPNVWGAYELVNTQPNAAEIEYDQGLMANTLRPLLEVGENEAITFTIKNGIMKASNLLVDSNDNEGDVEIPVICNVDIGPIVVNGKLFLKGVILAARLDIKDDNKRIVFHNEDNSRFFGLTRRVVT